MTMREQLHLIAGALNPDRKEAEGDPLGEDQHARVIGLYLEQFAATNYPDHPYGVSLDQ